jgi:hypothetical protein
MRVLFNDLVQKSNASLNLKTGALADKYTYSGRFTITFDFPAVYIDCIGIGYTNASVLKINFTPAETLEFNNGGASTTNFVYELNNGDALAKEFEYEYTTYTGNYSQNTEAFITLNGNGLYRIPPIVASAMAIECNGTYIGRLGAGRNIHIPTAIAKEPGFNHTAEPRKTLSGQIIQGASGYMYRTLTLDTRYKIDANAMDEIRGAYSTQIGRALPYFLLFDDEAYKLPFARLYAKDKNHAEYVFQGGIAKYRYSRKFDFEECF